VAKKAPLSRTEGLQIEEIDGELRVYDDKSDVTCVLNDSAALVWRSCDGRRSIADLVEILAAELGGVADEDMVLMALDTLAQHDLILSGYESRSSSAERLSRRRFFRRAGVAGAAAVAVPVVYSLALPEAALAYPAGYDSYL
jgi:hypothetical protein